jgi:hypothetical protein
MGIQANHPDFVPTYQLYHRIEERGSPNYKTVLKRTGRNVNSIFPRGWYFTDIDGVLSGAGCIHFGMCEFKQVPTVSNPFVWNAGQRDNVKTLLEKKCNYAIEYLTTNFSTKGTLGVWDGEDSIIPSFNSAYTSFCRQTKQLREPGKGLVLLILHTKDLHYFSVINCTGSEIVFNANTPSKWGQPDRFYPLALSTIGKIIEPCFDEFLYWLLHAYIRCDWEKLDYYFNSASEVGDMDSPLWLEHEIDSSIVESYTSLPQGIEGLKELTARRLAVITVMEELLHTIHFDTIVNEPDRYIQMVKDIRQGTLIKTLATEIRNTYQRFLEYDRKSKL